ncbi:CotH kinase family protein [Nonlabens ponticola]|uniref:Spore coat protein CotH n=1 Tax=Nonlabens ponticola TaxID=2496866 RepID=A0A3S9MYP7_9FLAO|nr:CotH kinase family protein [Nonlabens ponticola]AZQ44222.1 hypothetical protein EJ995_08230 [Nonlabens ponticola]
MKKEIAYGKSKLLLLMFCASISTHCISQQEIAKSKANSFIGHISFQIDDDNPDLAEVVPKDDYVETVFTFKDSTNALFGNVIEGKIRGRGNTTWQTAKKPYQIKLNESVSIAGIPAAKKWILLANYYDKTMLRNSLAFELSRLSQLEFTPDSKFYEVTLNGDSRGLYLLTEKVELQKNRIPKKNTFLLEIEPKDRMDEEDVYVKTEHYQFKIKEPNLVSGEPEYQQIEDFLLKTEDAFLNAKQDNYTAYKDYVDMDSFVDWYIIQEISRNNDASFYSSVYWTWQPGEKLKIGPIWDYDIAFGNINYSNSYKIEGLLFEGNDWLKYIMDDPKFIARRKERYAYFYSKKDALIKFIDDTSNMLQENAQRNHKKYNLLGRKLWPNRVARMTYEEEVNDLKDWLTKRMDYLNNEFVNE